MSSSAWIVAFLAVVPPGVAGCSPQSCTDVGSTNSVGVDIPRSLFVHSGRVDFEVCDDDGCEEASKPLGHLDEPVGRGSSATFHDLGRAFEPGAATVTVRLFDARDRLVAQTEQITDLQRVHPNGKECDGAGWINGGIKMRPTDRV